MNYRPDTLHRLPPQVWAGVLGIAWLLVLPVLALAVLLPWLEPRSVPASPAAEAPPPAAGLAGALQVFGNSLEAAFFFLGCLLVFSALVVVQAFWSPWPSYRRYLHARPRTLQLGAAVGWYALVHASPSSLATAWSTRYCLGCGALALGLPALIE
ncbi:hypothetical protein LJ737_14005 [Hymenobacter sp. 15J16-1T3B]|uniref:hypothetical protein n=1 Tax=Hymenobacter sp. 15J16-1T3B TaxID=2886941 RepID=UPI001D0FF63B|nr:hypothetical protein [Hymenobacter sp. 15J16-1T3B]MCC3158358.1 hypothetical protein [Hymenobacter sp. 15J16-1T3B]